MNKKTCETCKFWDDAGLEARGFCRKNAPTAYIWHAPNGDGMEYGPEALWATTHELDWCDEWSQKK